MRYHGPAGSSDPNAPYVGKSVAQQRQGSRIPPQVPEYVQRELVNVITAAGLSPTDDALDQVLRAIRGGQLTTLVDTSTQAGIITVGTAVQHTAYLTGLPLDILLNQDIAGDTYINLNGLGPRQVIQNGGGALAKGDYLKGDLVSVRYNAKTNTFTVLTPVNGVIISTPIVKTIGGAAADFPDINAAHFWASRRRVASTGFVTFNHLAGVGAQAFVYTSDAYFSHQDGERMALVAPSLRGSLPTPDQLAWSGVSASARASDTTANLATLRLIYATEIRFVGGARLHVKLSLSNIQDFLFSSDGQNANDNMLLRFGEHKITRCATVGAGRRGICLSYSYCYVVGTCLNLGAGSSAVSAENGSQFAVMPFSTLSGHSSGSYGLNSIGGSVIACVDPASSTLYARANGDTGILGNLGSIVASSTSVSRDNGIIGWAAVNTSSFNAISTAAYGNPIGYQAGQCAYMAAMNTTGTATNVFCNGFNGGVLARAGSTGTGTNGFSAPALGQVSADGGRVI